MGVPAEFKFPEREIADSKVNTELVNSKVVHSNRKADEQFLHFSKVWYINRQQICNLHYSPEWREKTYYVIWINLNL